MSKQKNTDDNITSLLQTSSFGASMTSFGMIAGLVLIAALVVVSYIPAINGGFVLDDDMIVSENPIIKAPDGIYTFWCTKDPQDYWPVTYTYFWLEWRLWDRNTTGYHATNIFLHIIEALLIWTILRKLSIPGAFLAALIFAVHPVNVESVAWISSLKNLMAMLFFLVSLLWYLRHLDTENTDGVFPKNRWYWLSTATFILAMLSKGSVAVMPMVLILMLWWKNKITIRNLAWTVPYFFIAGSLAIVNVWFQTHGDSEEVFRNATILQRLLGACTAIWFYLYKASFPLDLYFVYPLWKIDVASFLWWLPLFLTAIVTVVLWMFRKSWSRLVFFAWMFFCIGLVPVLGLTDVGYMRYSLVADRYQHIAIIAVVSLAAAGWSVWHKQAGYITRMASICTAAGILGVFCFLTWQQCKIYSDEITLYRAALAKNPDCAMIHCNLGFLLNQNGRFQESVKEFENAVGLDPNYVWAQSNLGSALSTTNRKEEAIEHLNISIKLKRNNTQAMNTLGIIYTDMGQYDDAVAILEKALDIQPKYADAENNLGRVMYVTGQKESAMKHFNRALDINPNLPDANANLGLIMQQSGRIKEAIKYYEKSILVKPINPAAQNNLGSALAADGRPKEAIEHYLAALKYQPNNSELYLNLAVAYAAANQPAQAMDAAHRGLYLARQYGQSNIETKIEKWLEYYRSKQ